MTNPLPEIVTDVVFASTISRTSVPGVLEENGCQRAGNFWYYDSCLELSIAPSVYSALTAVAAQRLWVWDRYLNAGDIEAFGSIRAGVSFRLLCEGSLQSAPFNDSLRIFAALFRERYPRVTLQIAWLNRDVYPNYDPAICFHDRYLFVDDDIYMVGSSLSSHCKREWATSIIKVNDAIGCDLLRYEFDKYWTHRFTKQWIR